MRLKRTIAVAPRLMRRFDTAKRDTSPVVLSGRSLSRPGWHARCIGSAASNDARRGGTTPDSPDDLTALAMYQQHMARISIEFVCFDTIASGFESPLNAIRLVSEATSRMDQFRSVRNDNRELVVCTKYLLTKTLDVHHRPLRPSGPRHAAQCPAGRPS
jgi:hypothetical protein